MFVKRKFWNINLVDNVAENLKESQSAIFWRLGWAFFSLIKHYFSLQVLEFFLGIIYYWMYCLTAYLAFSMKYTRDTLFPSRFSQFLSNHPRPTPHTLSKKVKVNWQEHKWAINHLTFDARTLDLWDGAAKMSKYWNLKKKSDLCAYFQTGAYEKVWTHF